MSLTQPRTLTGECNRAPKAEHTEQNVANSQQHKAEGVVRHANGPIEVTQRYFKVPIGEALTESAECEKSHRAEDQTAKQRKQPRILRRIVRVKRRRMPVAIHIPLVRGKILPNA